jgi:hypothetical protein
MNTTATDLPIKSPTQVIDIQAKLNEKPRKRGAAYTMIVGAGFSYGVVPLTEELLHERIGDFYYRHCWICAHVRSCELVGLVWSTTGANSTYRPASDGTSLQTTPSRSRQLSQFDELKRKGRLAIPAGSYPYRKQFTHDPGANQPVRRAHLSITSELPAPWAQPPVRLRCAGVPHGALTE